MTAAVVVLFAATSAAAEYALFSGGVGLSGIAYGFFGLLWVLSRRDARFLGTINAATSAVMIGGFVLCCVLTADIWRVGNAAHAGGAVAGLLLGLTLSSSRRGRWLAGSASAVVAAATLAGATVARPYVNLRGPNADEIAYLAYLDLAVQRDEAAVEKFERVIRLEPTRADCWYNLGTALHRLNRIEACVEAYQQALKLNAGDEQYKKMAAGMTAFLAYERQAAGNYKDAAKLYRQALAIDDRSALHWFNLGGACKELGEIDATLEAYQRAVTLDEKNVRYRAAIESLPMDFNVR